MNGLSIDYLLVGMEDGLSFTWLGKFKESSSPSVCSQKVKQADNRDIQKNTLVNKAIKQTNTPVNKSFKQTNM